MLDRDGVKGSKRKRGNSGWSDRPKKENGAGEYPPAHTYERRIRRVLPRARR